MTEPIFYGFLAGIILSFGFGSVFFALIQNSIDFGYKAGVIMAFGVIACDVIFVFFALNGTTYLPKIPDFDFYVRILGAILLVILGLVNIFDNQVSVKYPTTKKGKFGFFFSQGFLLNGINPVNFFAWVALSATLNGMKYNFTEQCLYLLSAILAIFTTESAIAYFAHRIKKHLSPASIKKVKILTGIVFFVIAGVLVRDLFINVR